MKSVSTGLGLVLASMAAGIWIGFPVGEMIATSAELSGRAALVLQLGGLEDLIERTDSLLEAVVDLLRTLGQLFGEGEGG